ncbi:hypothetical protein [Niabella hirudinis]|uniref:hypothetical protein n=1 Tax=Niabella hirudinis TaxID=1285929 RepID=UPI003EBAF134
MTLLRCAGINLAVLFAAAVADIIVSAVLLRLSSQALTIACFAVAGVFTAVFCFGLTESAAVLDKKNSVFRILIFILVFCALLFFVMAPLSGREYNGPVKFFAMAEVVTAIFLWKKKLYTITEVRDRNKNFIQ